jgi:hypothetical protein
MAQLVDRPCAGNFTAYWMNGTGSYFLGAFPDTQVGRAQT